MTEDSAECSDLLVLVWVHGFKGTEVTFEDFPQRLVRLLEETHPSLSVQSHVFPSYETRGELSAATENFVEWLSTKCVHMENGAGHGRGAGSAKVVLLGHSMGGLLIADATARIADSTRADDPMWPNVVATIAFDTPYLGLHPHVFKHQLSQAAGHLETAKNVASSLGMMAPLALNFGWGQAREAKEKVKEEEKRAAEDPAKAEAAPGSSWWKAKGAITAMGALAVGAAAAGTVYYQRDTFATGWKYGYDHMTFVKNLWDAEALKRRLEVAHELSKTRNVVFANYYTLIPQTATKEKRTFCILPPQSHPLMDRWLPAISTNAADEVTAHMGMFNPRSNDGFYDLGLAVASRIAERIESEGVRRNQATAGFETPVGEKGDLLGSGSKTDPIIIE